MATVAYLRRCSWKRTRLRTGGRQAGGSSTSLRLVWRERSPFCVCGLWSGASMGMGGRSNRARAQLAGPQESRLRARRGRAGNSTWQFTKIPVRRRARRVKQHRNRHVSRGHRVQFTNCQITIALMGLDWARFGPGRRLGGSLLGQPCESHGISDSLRSLTHQKHSFQHSPTSIPDNSA
jgi:hypothetical protein